MTLKLYIKSNIGVDISGMNMLLTGKRRKLQANTKRIMIEILKHKAPKDTGKFASTIRSYRETVRKSNGVNYHRFVVGPTAPNSIFIIRATKASPGRYVPAIRKRIKSGMHPGTAANPFLEKSVNIINREIKLMYKDELNLKRLGIFKFITRR